MADNSQSTTGSGSNPQAGAAASQKAKQAFQDWRQRRVAPSYISPGGPPFSGFPVPPPVGFSPASRVGFVQGDRSSAAGSLLSSLSTTLRLAIDLINTNLEGMLASSMVSGGRHEHGCGCESCGCQSCGCGVDCCQYFGASCCGCCPSVNNCCC